MRCAIGFDVTNSEGVVTCVTLVNARLDWTLGVGGSGSLKFTRVSGSIGLVGVLRSGLLGGNIGEGGGGPALD